MLPNGFLWLKKSRNTFGRFDENMVLSSFHSLAAVPTKNKECNMY